MRIVRKICGISACFPVIDSDHIAREQKHVHIQ